VTLQTRPGGEDELAVPEPTDADWALAAVTALISAVPLGVGHMANEFMRLVGTPIERRRNEWMETVAGIVRRLEAESLTMESLQADDQFISAVLQASAIAQRTHLKDKLDALRNALMNIALSQTPDETLQSIFLGYIDGFTEWHIRILRLYQAPSAKAMLTELYQVVEEAYPELKGRREIYDTVWQDLLVRGLVNMQSLHGAIADVTTIKTRRTTDLGDRFLRFIAEPFVSAPDGCDN
jgi:hypothetical protein